MQKLIFNKFYEKTSATNSMNKISFARRRKSQCTCFTFCTLQVLLREKSIRNKLQEQTSMQQVPRTKIIIKQVS